VSELLFASADRNKAHLYLEKVKPPAANHNPETCEQCPHGEHVKAECREDHNDPLPYQVWGGPIERVVTEIVKPAQPAIDQQMIAAIVAGVIEQLSAQTGAR
jgi:hypothetical protein